MPDEQLYIHVHWDADHTTEAGQTCSPAGAVGGPATVRIRFLKPQVPFNGPGGEITIHEVAGHAGDPDEQQGTLPFTAGPWVECGDPVPDPDHLYASYSWPSQFNNHNGPHTIYVKVVYGIGAPPNVQQVVLEKTITVDVQNLVVTSTTPSNPEPLKWKPGEMQSVPVSATVQAAYKASRQVTLEIFDSEQGLVRTLQQTVPLGGAGPSTVSFEWDGKNNAGTECPTGIYLFRFSLIVPGWAYGDHDSDKSGFLSIVVADPSPTPVSQSEDQAVYEVAYSLVSNPVRSATPGSIDTFDPFVTEAPNPIASRALGPAELTPGDHHVTVTIPGVPIAGTHWFLVSATDSHQDQDKGHRARSALQHNQRPPLIPTVLYGFKGITDRSVKGLWRDLVQYGWKWPNGAQAYDCGRTVMLTQPVAQLSRSSFGPTLRAGNAQGQTNAGDRPPQDGWCALAYSQYLPNRYSAEFRATCWFFFGHGVIGTRAGKAVVFAGNKWLTSSQSVSAPSGSIDLDSVLNGYSLSDLSCVHLCVLTACQTGKKSGPTQPKDFDTALRGRGVQNVITFSRIMSAVVADYWARRFWTHFLVVTPQQGQPWLPALPSVLDCATKAQDETQKYFSEHPFIGVPAEAYEDFVMCNGELIRTWE